jgi:hypothetical protein
MTKVHHLENKLKALKLGGMLDTLELRLDQARRNGPGPPGLVMNPISPPI